MKSVILAAGLGTRFGEHAERKPERLLEIGGSNLLDRSLTNLSNGGIKDVLIIPGFRNVPDLKRARESGF